MAWAAPMADAGQQGGEGTENAKEAVTELAQGVTEDIGVGERPVHKHQHETKARKPKMATMGVRQTWSDCVGEDEKAGRQAGLPTQRRPLSVWRGGEPRLEVDTTDILRARVAPCSHACFTYF